MNEKQLKFFANLQKSLEGGAVQPEEIIEVVEALISVMKEMREQLEAKMEDKHSSMSSSYQEMMGRMEEMQARTEKMKDEIISQAKKYSKEEVANLTNQLRGEVEGVKNLIPDLPQIPDITPLEKRIDDVEKKIPKIPDEIKPEQVRDKLENLEGEERLDKKAIKGLDEELKEIRNLPRGGGASRRVFQPYSDDFSALTDGSTKVFYLTRAPLSDVVFVFGTDFPTILRPTIDFTIANKTLTLTDAVPAPITGATLLVSYFS